MFLEDKLYSTILSIVWYFTGENQQDRTFNIFLLFKELEQSFLPYSKRWGGVGVWSGNKELFKPQRGETINIQNGLPLHYDNDFCDVPSCLGSAV